MSEIQSPYHHPFHQKHYNVQEPKAADGQIGLLLDQVEELLHPELPQGSHSLSANCSGYVISRLFNHTYIRTSSKDWIWPYESVSVTIDHSIFLGKTALKQAVSLKFDSSILQSRIDEDGEVVAIQNKISSHYHLEEFAGRPRSYGGLVLRPDIIGEDLRDEAMTVYDCEQLFDQLVDVERSLNASLSEDRLISKT